MNNSAVGALSWVYSVVLGFLAISALWNSSTLGLLSLGVLVGSFLLIASAVLALPPVGRWLAMRWNVRSGMKFGAVGVLLLLGLVIVPAAQQASATAEIDRLREQIKATVGK